MIAYLSTGVPINLPALGSTAPSYFNQRADLTCDPSQRRPALIDSLVQRFLLHASRRCARQHGRINGEPVRRRQRAGIS